MREKRLDTGARCITPQNRLRRCLRGPRRGFLSNVVRVQNQIAEKDGCKKPRYSDEEQGKAAPSRQECITPQNRLRRCLRGPRRGFLSNAMRVQGGFDAVIRRIRRLQKNRDISCRRRHPKPSYSDEMRESPAAQDSRCITPRCLRGPRRGSLSNAMRVQGGFDAVIRRIRRLQKNRDIRMKGAKSALTRARGVLGRT